MADFDSDDADEAEERDTFDRARLLLDAEGLTAAAEKAGRIAATKAKAREKVAQGQTLLDRLKESSEPVRITFDTFRNDRTAGGAVLAAALGFRAFFFMIPYFWFLSIIVGLVASAFGKKASDFVHTQGIASIAAKGISGSSSLSGGLHITVILVASYALFVGARGFVKVLRTTHVLIWRVEPKKLLRPTRATLMVIAVSTVALALSFVVGLIRDLYFPGYIVAVFLYAVVPFFCWMYASWWLPHGNCQFFDLAPGAAVFAFGVEILHAGTLYYLPHEVNSKSEIYGVLGLALTLLLWAYLLGRLMILAAAFNYTMWIRKGHEVSEDEIVAPHLPLLKEGLGRAWNSASAFRKEHDLTIDHLRRRHDEKVADDSPDVAKDLDPPPTEPTSSTEATSE